MKIAVYGNNGQIAKCLSIHGKDFGHEVTNFGREISQIDDLTGISSFLEAQKPDFLINAAAYNDVDGAESNFEEAMRINAFGPRALAIAANEANIPFLHFSTDYVFDGTKCAPYFETDKPNPINKYGLSKLRGEELVLENHPRAIIMRVSWVFSEFSSNFVKSMLKIAQNGRESISIVDDQFGVPNSAHDIAVASIKIAEQMKGNNQLNGLFQFSSEPIVSRFEFAAFIFQKARDFNLKSCQITPIKSAQFPTLAKRPALTPMNGAKLAKTFGIEIKDWQNSLDEIFIKIAKNI